MRRAPCRQEGEEQGHSELGQAMEAYVLSQGSCSGPHLLCVGPSRLTWWAWKSFSGDTRGVVFLGRDLLARSLPSHQLPVQKAILICKLQKTAGSCAT